MKYITNATAITLFLSTGERVRVEKTDKVYPKILKVFSLPVEEQEDAVLQALNPVTTKVNVQKALENEEKFEVVGDDIIYDGEKLPTVLASKIKSIIKD